MLGNKSENAFFNLLDVISHTEEHFHIHDLDFQRELPLRELSLSCSQKYLLGSCYLETNLAQQAGTPGSVAVVLLLHYLQAILVGLIIEPPQTLYVRYFFEVLGTYHWLQEETSGAPLFTPSQPNPCQI